MADEEKNQEQTPLADETFDSIMDDAKGVVGGSPESETKTQDGVTEGAEKTREELESDLEQLKNTQRKHQNLIEGMKSDFPEVYDHFYQPEALPIVEAPVDNHDDLIISDDDFITPQKMVQILDERDRKKEVQRKQAIYQRQKVQLQDEITHANQIMNQCSYELGLTSEEYNQAVGFAGEYVSGDQVGQPAKFAKLAYQKMSEIAQSKMSAKNITQAQADAGAKAKAALVTQQPATGSPPLGEVKKLTQEEKLIQMMQGAGSNDADKEFFG